MSQTPNHRKKRPTLRDQVATLERRLAESQKVAETVAADARHWRTVAHGYVTATAGLADRGTWEVRYRIDKRIWDEATYPAAILATMNDYVRHELLSVRRPT